MDMTSFIQIVRDLAKKVEDLQRARLTEVVIPTDGKFVVETRASDPPVENGRIYYNSTTHKLRGCENGAWANLI